MASVTGKTSAAIDALVAVLLSSAAIDESGHLTVTTHGGTVTDLGPVVTSLPSATETVAGILKVATSALITAGTDDTTAVSPLGLAAVVATLNTSISGKQPSDPDLTAIAALTPATSDVLQYESGAWSHRTPAQLATDLFAAAPVVKGKYYSSSTWNDATSPRVWVGSVDPTTGNTVNDGSVWFDTSGV